MNRYPLSTETIKEISRMKQEPEWMLEFRLNSYEVFKQLGKPDWSPDISGVDFSQINYFIPANEISESWNDVPEKILKDFERIGVPERERKYLAGVSTQYDSEIVYHRLKNRFEKQGIVFETIENGLKKYPELFKEYFAQLIKPSDNKFAALNSAMWSGGSFVYIPKDVKVKIPIETYFRIDAKSLGQFERTLIIADENSSVHYIEGCTAPQYLSTSLHAGVVEIFALKGANVTYTTLQNWSTNVYNMVTKRALANQNATVEWVDCNIGSKITMKYPSVILQGDNSSGKMTSLAISGEGQNIDSGGKMIHLGANTKSIIRSKTICADGGIATYRGKSKITAKAKDSLAVIECESLLMDPISLSKAIPIDEISNNGSTLEHEAYVSSISEEQINYLMSKGLAEAEAKDLIVQGFAQSFLKLLPPEYSIELERILYHFTQNHEKN